jgi:hypothetical protein
MAFKTTDINLRRGRSVEFRMVFAFRTCQYNSSPTRANLAHKVVVTLHYSISLCDYRKTLRVYAAEQISGRARLSSNSPSCQMFLPRNWIPPFSVRASYVRHVTASDCAMTFSRESLALAIGTRITGQKTSPYQFIRNSL